MKKILFFTNGLYGGGAEKVLQTLLQHIDKSKFEITLYSLKQEKLNNLYPEDIIYRYIFSSYPEQCSFLKKCLVKCKNKILLWVYYHCSPRTFYKLFIKESYDTEVAFIEGYATRIISGSPNLNSKKIAWVHINLEINHWTTIAFQNSKEEEEAYTKFNQVISVSQSVQATTEKLFKNINNSITLYNPIDANNIIELSSQFVPFNQSSQRIRLVSVGRYVQQKAFHRLVSITARLVTEGYDIELWLVGEGEQRILLEKQIEKLNLKDRAFLTGFQNNPYPYIKNADVLDILMKRLLDALNLEFGDGEHVINVRASIGIALTQKDGVDLDILYEKSYKALYQVKNQGKNNYAIYQAEDNNS